MITRRNFLRASGAALLATAGLGAYARWVEPHWLEFVHRPLPIRGLPKSLEGRSLVQLSDIHVGSVDDQFMIDAFRRVAALRPDIVVVTGDLMSYYRNVYQQIAFVFRHFPKGRKATLGILGNHDYGPDWAHPEVAERVVETITPFGITVLRNQIHEVEGLQLVGLDDFWAKELKARQVLPLLRSTEPALVLSHNPDTVDLPVWDGYEGWILSGHTHGGQCKPPFLRPPLLPCRNRRYTSGEFELSGGRRLYISRGVGHLLQARFNVRPEVTVFELRRA